MWSRSQARHDSDDRSRRGVAGPCRDECRNNRAVHAGLASILRWHLRPAAAPRGNAADTVRSGGWHHCVRGRCRILGRDTGSLCRPYPAPGVGSIGADQRRSQCCRRGGGTATVRLRSGCRGRQPRPSSRPRDRPRPGAAGTCAAAAHRSAGGPRRGRHGRQHVRRSGGECGNRHRRQDDKGHGGPGNNAPGPPGNNAHRRPGNNAHRPPHNSAHRRPGNNAHRRPGSIDPSPRRSYKGRRGAARRDQQPASPRRAGHRGGRECAVVTAARGPRGHRPGRTARDERAPGTQPRRRARAPGLYPHHPGGDHNRAGGGGDGGPRPRLRPASRCRRHQGAGGGAAPAGARDRRPLWTGGPAGIPGRSRGHRCAIAGWRRGRVPRAPAGRALRSPRCSGARRPRPAGRAVQHRAGEKGCGVVPATRQTTRGAYL